MVQNKNTTILECTFRISRKKSEVLENSTKRYFKRFKLNNMGKKTKEHRKKVAARNQKLTAQKSAMQKVFDESMKKQLEDLKKQYDANKPGEQQPTA